MGPLAIARGEERACYLAKCRPIYDPRYLLFELIAGFRVNLQV